MFAQNKYSRSTLYGGGIETFGSKNGHGQFYSPYLSIHKFYHAINVGIIMQRRSMDFCGLKIAFSQSLTGRRNIFLKDEYFYNYKYPDLFQLNFFASFQCNKKIPLSYSASKTESEVAAKSDPCYSSFKLATAEMAAGLGFQINLTNNFTWNIYAGPAFYYHFNYADALQHKKSGLSCYIGTSVNFVLR